MIEFSKCRNGATLPARQTKGSAGYDLYATEKDVIYPKHRVTVATGIVARFDSNLVGEIWPRSGPAVRCGIDTLAGVIDSDYEKEIMIVLINHGPFEFRINPGDRVAQILFKPVITTGVVETVRDGGFGSTDCKTES